MPVSPAVTAVHMEAMSNHITVYAPGTRVRVPAIMELTIADDGSVLIELAGKQIEIERQPSKNQMIVRKTDPSDLLEQCPVTEGGGLRCELLHGHEGGHYISDETIQRGQAGNFVRVLRPGDKLPPANKAPGDPADVPF